MAEQVKGWGRDRYRGHGFKFHVVTATITPGGKVEAKTSCGKRIINPEFYSEAYTQAGHDGRCKNCLKGLK